MQLRLDTLRLPTKGERSLALAVFVVGLLGAYLALTVVLRLSGGPAIGTALSYYDYWVIGAGAAAAVFALYVSKRFLGHGGYKGWARALWGVLHLSFIGSLVAGTLALPVYGTMFGPFTLAVSLIGAPFLGIAWLSGLLAAHAMLVPFREERAEQEIMGRLRGAHVIGAA